MTCLSWGLGLVLWWQGKGGLGGLNYVPCILFIHVMMRPLVLFLGGQVHHHFLFVCLDTQGTRRCRTSMLHVKMVGHTIQPNCISAQHAIHGPVGARISQSYAPLHHTAPSWAPTHNSLP